MKKSNKEKKARRIKKAKSNIVAGKFKEDREKQRLKKKKEKEGEELRWELLDDIYREIGKTLLQNIFNVKEYMDHDDVVEYLNHVEFEKVPGAIEAKAKIMELLKVFAEERVGQLKSIKDKHNNFVGKIVDQDSYVLYTNLHSEYAMFGQDVIDSCVELSEYIYSLNQKVLVTKAILVEREELKAKGMSDEEINKVEIDLDTKIEDAQNIDK